MFEARHRCRWSLSRRLGVRKVPGESVSRKDSRVGRSQKLATRATQLTTTLTAVGTASRAPTTEGARGLLLRMPRGKPETVLGFWKEYTTEVPLAISKLPFGHVTGSWNPARAIGIHDAAMSETFNSSLDEARLRAADYRMRAEELRMRAASIEWDEARANILKVAETYDALAQTIEDIAERRTLPWMPGGKPQA